MPDAQPKPTAAEVLREHSPMRLGYGKRDGMLSVQCMSDGRWRAAEDHARHQSDMLAAAGLLATAEHDAQVLRDAADAYTPYEGGETESMVTRRWLRARADRIAAGEEP